MLYTLSNYTDLYKKQVKLNDTINFEFEDKIYNYQVRETYLACRNDKEAIILHILQNHQLISNSIDEFCSSCYGYLCLSRHNSNTWPDYNTKDYKAATRIILAIFELLTAANIPCKEVELATIPNLPIL